MGPLTTAGNAPSRWTRVFFNGSWVFFFIHGSISEINKKNQFFCPLPRPASPAISSPSAVASSIAARRNRNRNRNNRNRNRIRPPPPASVVVVVVVGTVGKSERLCALEKSVYGTGISVGDVGSEEVLTHDSAAIDYAQSLEQPAGRAVLQGQLMLRAEMRTMLDVTVVRSSRP